mmetsp:Transcript_62399/g.146308  ORF Transcript_62399/g.146308 Transcript_62399/m.146308 type:complete len:218 (-) Transcript_62399:171-824(-)
MPDRSSAKACSSSARTATRSRSTRRGEPSLGPPSIFCSSYLRESKRRSRPRAVWVRTASRQSSLKARSAVNAAASVSGGAPGSDKTSCRGSASGAATRGRQSCNTLRSSEVKTSAGLVPSAENSGRSASSRFNASFFRRPWKAFSRALLRRNCALNDRTGSSPRGLRRKASDQRCRSSKASLGASRSKLRASSSRARIPCSIAEATEARSGTSSRSS